VKLYVEGGGDTEFLQSLCERGFRQFLEAAGLHGKMPRIVACGGRGAAYDNFKTAMKKRQPGTLPLLLVDSETAVGDNAQVWRHLKERDGWEKPAGAKEEQAFVMVQCMETWFLADREALASFFVSGFKDKAIPKWPNLEGMEKSTVLEVLASATAHCDKKVYAKGNLSFELLAQISPAKVEKACPHAARFLSVLRNL
jgi:hypothetical protein